MCTVVIGVLIASGVAWLAGVLGVLVGIVIGKCVTSIISD